MLEYISTNSFWPEGLGKSNATSTHPYALSHRPQVKGSNEQSSHPQVRCPMRFILNSETLPGTAKAPETSKCPKGPRSACEARREVHKWGNRSGRLRVGARVGPVGWGASGASVARGGKLGSPCSPLHRRISNILQHIVKFYMHLYTLQARKLSAGVLISRVDQAFLEWYSSVLIRHGRLGLQRRSFKTSFGCIISRFLHRSKGAVFPVHEGWLEDGKPLHQRL